MMTPGLYASANIYNLDDQITEVADYLSDYEIIVIAESTHSSSYMDTLKIDIIMELYKSHDYGVLALENSNAEMNYYLSNPEDYSFETIKNESVMPAFRKDSFNRLFETAIDQNEDFQLIGMSWLPVVYDRYSYNTVYLEEIYNDIAYHNEQHADNFKSAELNFRRVTEDLQINFMEPIDYETLDIVREDYNEVENSDYFSNLNVSSQDFILERVRILSETLDPDYLKEYDIKNNTQHYYSLRGKGMYDRIVELTDKHDKIIVWVHNFHAHQNPENLIPHNEFMNMELEETPYTLGKFLNQSDLDVYNIGVFFNEGEHISYPGHIPRKSGENDLENHLYTYELPHLFVDLKNEAWSNESFNAYDEGYNKYEFKPIEQFDGLIYIDKIHE